MNQEVNKPDLPLVSVIIPAHNEDKYIGATLSALEQQTYPRERLEVIVVDNNSTDDTRRIVSQYQAKLLEKKDGLVGSVRNFGFENASGDIIAFLDADCIAPPDWVKEGVSLITSTKDHAYGGFCLVQENPSFIEKFWLLESESPQKDLLGASIFIRREHFKNVGQFDENISSGEDSKLSASLRRMGVEVSLSKKISVIHLGNPPNFRSFIKRQIWHSENYFNDLSESMRDPVFFLVALWTIAFLATSFSAIFFPSKTVTLPGIILLLVIPAIFSAKRILRSTDPKSQLVHAHNIYTLDILYVVGRAIGLAKSLLRLLMGNRK